MVQVATWTNPDATRLRLTFPDGTVVEDEVRLDGPIETPIHGRTAVGHIVEGPWAAALSALPRPAGPHRPLRPDRRDARRRTRPRLVSDGSLDALGAVLGVGDVDARRFRMLIELEGGDAARGGHLGRLAGSVSARPILGSARPVARCAMTTHDPDTGQRDYDTLRAIKDYRGQVDGKDLMFGVRRGRDARASSGSATRSASWLTT